MVADSSIVIPPAASVVAEMLKRFDEFHIEYCHWKSNEHAVAAVAGDTDLDLLFNAGQRELVERTLLSIGFKLLRAAEHAAYDGIIDYVALDAAALKMIHVHAHYDLRLGEKFVKSYRLPWERLILDTRVLQADSRMFATRPDLETVLLLVRYSLKLRWRDHVRMGMGRWRPEDDFTRELKWLLDRVRTEDVVAHANRLLGPQAAAAAESVLSEPELTAGSARKLRRAVKGAIACHRSMSAARAFAMALRRELLLYWLAFRRRILGQPVPMRRTNPAGGLVVVVAGIDGSGKSTITERLAHALTRKLDVMSIYFGTGEGAAPLFRAINCLRRQARSSRSMDKQVPGEARSGPPSGLKRLAYAGWAVLSARAKRRALRRLLVARETGQIVMCDRYPQTQIPKIGDGPMLGEWLTASSWPLRWAAAYEARVFQEISAHPPDLLFKLNIRPVTAFSRKTNQPDLIVLEQKAQVIEAMNFGESTTVVQVDAEQPLPTVLSAVGAKIWSHYP